MSYLLTIHHQQPTEFNECLIEFDPNDPETEEWIKDKYLVKYFETIIEAFDFSTKYRGHREMGVKKRIETEVIKWFRDEYSNIDNSQLEAAIDGMMMYASDNASDEDILNWLTHNYERMNEMATWNITTGTNPEDHFECCTGLTWDDMVEFRESGTIQ